MKDYSKNRLTDGCLEVDKGTKHQVGHGRLWFPDSPLKGLTSDANPHSHPPFIHPSLSPTFFPFLHSKSNSVFHPAPWGTVLSHLPIQRGSDGVRKKKEKREKKKKKHRTCLTEGHRTLRRTVQGWKDRQNQDRGRKVSTADWALTTANNRHRWKAGVKCWKVAIVSKWRWLN